MYKKSFVVVIFSFVLFLFLSSSSNANAAQYYIDSVSGADGNSGNSTGAPWKTLSKVNSANFSPGDTISFKRGGSWTGMLTINDSGQNGNPITFNAYGSGNAPTITNPCAGCYSDIIQVWSSYVVVKDFLLSDAHQAAIHLKPGSGNVIVSDNEITRTGIGVLVQTSNNLITRNNVHDLTMIVNTSSADDDYGANGFWLQTANNNEISYNKCITCKAPSIDYGTDGGFVEFWTENNNNSIHHNWVENTNGFIEVGGTGSGTVTDNTISYNVSLNNTGFGCFHTDGTFRLPIVNLRIENNTIVSTNGAGYRVLDCITPTPEMLYFRNNIVYSSVTMANSGNFTRANNIYYMFGGAFVGYSLGSGEKTENPLFVDINSKNFHLQSGSPALDSGLNLGYSNDFENLSVPAGNGVDMGAFEYSGSVPPTSTPTPTQTTTPTPRSTSTPAPGDTQITIFAAGTPAGGLFPTMNLLIDDTVVASWTNVSGNPSARVFGSYTYFSSTPVVPAQIKVAFINDTTVGTEDSNLYVDKIVIGSTSYETEADSTYSTGSYSLDTGCGPGYKKSEILHCNGYFSYQAASTPSKPGDANGDTKVDGLDYVIWLTNYSLNQSGSTKGDFNNDNKVDGLDYVIWLNGYGK